MSKTKRYFWLKFKEDFFNQKEIKKLRRIAGGDTFTIIYLKMQLLSVKKEGMLTFDGTEENLAEQLSLEIDEDTDNIKITIEYLVSNKLIEKVSDENFLLNKVPTLIGKETDSAERMRRLRAKPEPELIEASQCSPNVRTSDTELEKEKEKEIKKELKRVDIGFGEFWKAYPKKKAKGQAEKAWKKIDPSLFTEILDALENHKMTKDWIKEEGKYIPYPASWLNAKRWEDDVEVNENNVATLNDRIMQDLQRW